MESTESPQYLSLAPAQTNQTRSPQWDRNGLISYGGQGSWCYMKVTLDDPNLILPYCLFSPLPGLGRAWDTQTLTCRQTARVIPDFMGAGGRVRAARPAGPPGSPRLLGDHCFWLRRRRLQRGRDPFHRDTRMSPVTVKYKGGQTDERPNGRGVREARGPPLLDWRGRGRTVTQAFLSPTLALWRNSS